MIVGDCRAALAMTLPPRENVGLNTLDARRREIKRRPNVERGYKRCPRPQVPGLIDTEATKGVAVFISPNGAMDRTLQLAAFRMTTIEIAASAFGLLAMTFFWIPASAGMTILAPQGNTNKHDPAMWMVI